jgi:hypothetical protein
MLPGGGTTSVGVSAHVTTGASHDRWRRSLRGGCDATPTSSSRRRDAHRKFVEECAPTTTAGPEHAYSSGSVNAWSSRTDKERVTMLARLLARSGRWLRRAATWPAHRPQALRSQPGTPVLFPSLGYFGGIAASHLSITVDGPVRGIRLSLPPGATGRVDLRGLELFRDGRKVAVDLRKVTVTQSSDDCRGSSRRNPFTYGDLRTLKEKDPWWEARFDQPVDADTIRIYNRRDGHGARRSLRLVLAVAPAPREAQG